MYCGMDMFVLIVGCGRVGSAIANSMMEEGHEVSVLDEDAEAIALLDRGQENSWEERGGQFTEGTALEIDALLAAGIERADAFVAATDGDNTNIVIAQIARRRFEVPTVIARVLDPYRAEWYEQQGLHTICPTRAAIDMLETEVREVAGIEGDRARYDAVEQELEQAVQYGDASELWVLERAGIGRADMVIAVTGDDEDNILICQVAKEKYLVDRIIARVNNPRNREHFELLGIRPVVSATDLILRLIEHEVPEYGLVHLLDLPEQRLEIIEILLPTDSRAAGQRVGDLQMPEGALLISVLREGTGFVPNSETVLEAGDEILAVLDPTVEEDVTARFGSDAPAATTP